MKEYEPLTTQEDDTTTTDPPKTTSLLQTRVPRRFLVAGVLFGGLLIASLVSMWQEVRVNSISSVCISAPTKRVYLRTSSIGVEGIGSALQHFKHSIVLSNALDTTLMLPNTTSHHGYSTSDLLNGEGVVMDPSKVCLIADVLPDTQRDKFVRGLCKGNEESLQQLDDMKLLLKNCTAFVDSHQGEITQDLNGCIVSWVRSKLAPSYQSLPSLGSPPSRTIRVGVHIRWGDRANLGSDGSEGSKPTHFYGSMWLPHIVTILSDLRTASNGHGIVLTVAMEEADTDVLAWLNETQPYTLLDSGDALGDLRKLSDNDVLLLGESSYGVLAHMLAPRGLSIVELQRGLGKYDNTSGFGRQVLYLKDYDADRLRLGFENA
ncbi:hypothetical protein FB45DRAFT_908589 [Roridomyces roridus]|uniref:Uncharacterized protein n=1 Tax=Roridomyces roridus TaxID=1738132 RepID=A0AAD7FQV5_9AGAR|nr:hypothetical protein FB45DRAFT_908589 [Roridomyces roridus]